MLKGNLTCVYLQSKEKGAFLDVSKGFDIGFFSW